MKPVDYSGKVKAVVDAFQARAADQKVGGYWSDNEAADVRKTIKDHYIAEQDFRCCYCQQKTLSKNNAVWDGEHVIARDARPEFMFEPRNLAISCKDCNLAKRQKNVLKNPKRKTFPAKSEDYLIVHPHFDDYGKYILWFGSVVTPSGVGSKKGAATIHMCDLYRYAAQDACLSEDVGDQRYRDRIGELLTARSQKLAQEILGELSVQTAKLGK